MNVVSKTFGNPQETPESESIFASIKTDLNAPFVPNFFKVWGDTLDALRGIFPAMKHILGSGGLERRLKEMIILAISSLNKCHYCVAAHQVFCKKMGVSPGAIESLTAIFTLPEGSDTKDKAAIDYAVRLAKNSKSGTDEDIEHLCSLGFSKAEILEIIAMSGMSVYYNHLADSTTINIDQVFLGSLNGLNSGRNGVA